MIPSLDSTAVATCYPIADDKETGDSLSDSSSSSFSSSQHSHGSLFSQLHIVEATSIEYDSSSSDLGDKSVDGCRAQATPLALHFSNRCLGSNFVLNDEVSDPVEYTRPEFLFARVWKPYPTSNVGIAFERSEGIIVIASIAKEGLFYHSNLRPGDVVVSINGMPCHRRSLEKVTSMIRQSPGTISIVVHNVCGNPELVSTAVRKPAPNRKAGIAFKNKHGMLRIHRIQPDGLFSESLLTVGSKCVFLNGHSSAIIPSFDAATAVTNTDGFVTIVSRPKDGCAAVVAFDSKKRWKEYLTRGGRRCAIGKLIKPSATY